MSDTIPFSHPQLIAMREEHEAALQAERARADDRLTRLEVVVQRAIATVEVKVAHQKPCTRNVEVKGGACSTCDANDAHAALHAALKEAGLA